METLVFLTDCEHFKKGQEVKLSLDVAKGLIKEGVAEKKVVKPKK
jgi:hypothetical protein